MKLSVENLKKPSHKKWKRIADYLLYTGLPAAVVFFTTIQPVSEKFSLYGIGLCTLFITLFKGASKFSSDEIH